MAPRAHAGHGVGRTAGIAGRPGAGAARQRAQDDERGHGLPEREFPELMLGRYRVLEERGKGGFGTVSVCWDPRLMRRVAIKVIPLHGPRKKGGEADEHADDLAYMDPQARAMEQARASVLLRAALSETRTASMLPHPNVVSMLEFESDESNAYIIMEYVEGASLAELLDATEDGLLTADEAAAIADAVGDALAFAHENGVLHLDIKPDNILVDASGRVRLADFGMAALSSITGFGGAAGGTVGYMPPEQIQAGQVDVRTDVFAFAAVMYEALTGVRPFAAQTAKQSLELICGQIADPCALNDAVSPLTADAVLSALEPDPEMRPTSVRALTDEMLAGLGSPRAGRSSLASLVADVTSDEQDEDADEEGAWDEDAAWDERGPLARSFPRLAGWLTRVLAGFTAAWLAALSSMVWASAGAGSAAGSSAAGAAGAGAVGEAASAGAALASQGALQMGTVGGAVLVGLVVGVLGTLIPQLAGALAIVALVAASLAVRAWALAAVVLVAGGAWWLFCVRSQPDATGAPLAAGIGAQAASPVPSALCGLLHTPGRAAVSAAMAFVVALALCALAGIGSLSSPGAAAYGMAAPVRVQASFVSLVGDPATWVSAAGWVGAAAALSALCSSGGKGRCYLGILAYTCVLLAFQVVITRMENGGLWASPAPEAVVGILASSILVTCILCLFGPPRSFLGEGHDDGPDDDLAREDL